MNRFRARIGRGPPVVIAHRGDSAHAPENTLDAARLGHAAGSFAWELDVYLTRDGVPVVVHDESLLRAGFGLTPAEARLTTRLATGRPLRDCAADMRISYENGRQRAKVIYSKLGVAGHAELVAFVHALRNPSSA